MLMPLVAPRYTIADLDHFPDDGNRYELLAGALLVTPAPGAPHQVALGRLTMALAQYLGPAGLAVVTTPGVIQAGDDTQLEPDLLVVPARCADNESWRQMADWWLAVEVSGRASRSASGGLMRSRPAPISAHSSRSLSSVRENLPGSA